MHLSSTSGWLSSFSLTESITAHIIRCTAKYSIQMIVSSVDFGLENLLYFVIFKNLLFRNLFFFSLDFVWVELLLFCRYTLSAFCILVRVCVRLLKTYGLIIFVWSANILPATFAVSIARWTANWGFCLRTWSKIHINVFQKITTDRQSISVHTFNLQQHSVSSCLCRGLCESILMDCVFHIIFLFLFFLDLFLNLDRKGR